jgi:predicted small lipoprotein YifL
MVHRVAVVLLCVAALACGGEAPETVPPSTTAAADDEGHAHTAPHGGVLVEVGDHFAFLEVVLDPDAGSLTAYVLDGEAEKALRIAQPSISLTFETPSSVAKQTLILAAKANVLTGETVGDTSEFSIIHPAFKGQTMLSARVAELTVKGQTFKDLAVAKLK